MTRPDVLLLAALTLLGCGPTAFGMEHKPRIGILLARVSYARNRYATQMSGKGWAGIANLAGIPYDTLLLEDIAAPNLSRYRLLVFARCSSREDKLLPTVASGLERYLCRTGTRNRVTLLSNLTAIGRLDADVSENYNYQAQTLKFWVQTAKDSGVAPLYAFVSDGAAKAGWDKLAPFAKELQALGGAVGSHSKTHGAYFDTGVMTDAAWQEWDRKGDRHLPRSCALSTEPGRVIT